MSATCRDCGKPVRQPAVECVVCGERTWYHVSPADVLACPGTGVHVQVVTA